LVCYVNLSHIYIQYKTIQHNTTQYNKHNTIQYKTKALRTHIQHFKQTNIYTSYEKNTICRGT